MHIRSSAVWLTTTLCYAAANVPPDKMLAGLPITFERNQGQFARGVEFGAHIGGHQYTFGAKGIVIDGTLQLDMISLGNGVLEALESVDTKTNYLIGIESGKWITGVPNYRRIRRHNVLPGIDLILYGSHGQLEFDYVVAPGANPDLIRLRVHGASVQSSSRGLSLIGASDEAVELKAPVAYQESSEGRRSVDCRFQLRTGGEIGNATGPYNRELPLLIDPVLILLGTIRGTSASFTYSYPVVTDATGNFYLAGNTLPTNFPTTPGTLRSQPICTQSGVGPPCIDSWVMKFSPGGNKVIWATYFGPARIRTIALDVSGNLVLGGAAGIGFPVTQDAYLAKPPSAGFLTKINASGTALLYSTFLGNGTPSHEAGFSWRSLLQQWSYD